DVPQFLQGSEYEERVDEQREELADGYLLCKDEVQHQEQDRRSQQIHARSLNEAETAEIAHLLQLELEDLLGRRIEARNLLLRETEALDQLDVPKRFSRCARERGRLGDDHFLHALDSTAQHRAEQAKQWNREQKRRCDGPVNLVRIHHHEDDANDRRKENVHGCRYEPLRVESRLLDLSERLTAALILEERVWQLERVSNSVGIEIDADALRNYVDEIILECLGYP